MVRLDIDTGLTSGVNTTPSFVQGGGYDAGGWFNAGSPTILTVPAGVSLIQVWGRITVTPSGTPATTSHFTVSVLKNGSGALFQPGAFALRYPMVFANNTASAPTFMSPPVVVSPGDQISFSFNATFAGAASVTATAANTTVGAFAVR